MDAFDKKLTEAFLGKVVRKDLLLQVRKGTNVPSFVLEFLLARFHHLARKTNRFA